MFEISVTREFAAAHRLNNYQGPCSNLHGHTWKVQVSVRAQQLPASGMVIDFKDLKTALHGILQRYDHGLINDIPPFDAINPTAENMAREIYLEIKSSLAGHNLHKVTVRESSSACAVYWEE